MLCMPMYFYTHYVQRFIPKFVRVQRKIRAFLVLKYIQKHIQFIETTVMKMHTDTVESPVLASQRPLWEARGRARGSRPAGQARRARELPSAALGSEIAPITKKRQHNRRTGRSFVGQCRRLAHGRKEREHKPPRRKSHTGTHVAAP